MAHSADTSTMRSVRDVGGVAMGRAWHFALPAAALAWSYWSVLVGLNHEWQNNENYSVGQLVPMVALYLVWQERAALRKLELRPCWWGLGVMVLAEAVRAFGLLRLYESAERYALVISVAGLVLLVAGRRVFGQLRWVLAFLLLMVPLPGRVHNLIAGPMQTLATSSAVFVLELFGVTVSREGNIMVLNESVRIAVVEACSGLRMLTAFVVVAAAMAYLVERPRWQKVVLLASSVAVAMVCNLIRLAVTALLFLWADNELAELFFHDFAGWTMMPLAVFILVFELWIMSKVVIDDPVEVPV